jgi:hypothetical protein
MKIESRVQYRNNIKFIFQKCFKTGNKIIFIKMNVSFNFNLLIYEHALSTDFVSAILLMARIVCLFFFVFFSVSWTTDLKGMHLLIFLLILFSFHSMILVQLSLSDILYYAITPICFYKFSLNFKLTFVKMKL